jgi:hypothetical protein
MRHSASGGDSVNLKAFFNVITWPVRAVIGGLAFGSSLLAMGVVFLSYLLFGGTSVGGMLLIELFPIYAVGTGSAINT